MSLLGLEIATRSQEEILQNLIQLYTHDFSEHWQGTTKGDVNAQGRFPDYPLAAYWTDAGHMALLLWVHGALAGFALVNDRGHSGHAVDANVAEFFIMRKYRGEGVGTRFAHALFERRPGIWEVAIARKNIGAMHFWRGAVERFASADLVAELDIASPDWNGPVLRFRTGVAS